MRRIPAETKQAIIKKALSNSDQTLAEIALANNIGKSTLWKWINHFKSLNPTNNLGNQNLSSKSSMITQAERFKYLQGTFSQDDVM